jgi:hypothetical protein
LKTRLVTAKDLIEEKRQKSKNRGKKPKKKIKKKKNFLIKSVKQGSF